MSLALRYKKRPTRKLSEVVESDLLTAQEKFVKREIGGIYSMNDESAYFRVSGEKAQMTVDEFEKKIKRELHPHFFVMFNSAITAKHMVEGHSIGFYVPEFSGFVPLCRVGISGSNLISANSQGSVQKYIGKTSLKEKEKTVISRGWVAAYEFCKQYLFDAKTTGGIKQSRIVKAGEFMVMRDLAGNIGGNKVLDKVFEEARILRDSELDKAIAAAKEKEAAKAELTKAAALEFDKLSKESGN